MALIFFCVGVPFQVGELKSRSICHTPFFFLLIILSPEFREDLLGAGYDLRELDEFPPEKDADRVFAVQG
jgi:hypothetical protein